MSPADRVPDVVIGRIPLYLRTLSQFQAQGIRITSSKELAAVLGTSADQIRKDLSHFGGFGKQGTGYHISYLVGQLKRILHADREWEVALVGAGSLGSALLNCKEINRRGFAIVAAFDRDPTRIGSQAGGVTIQDGRHIEDEIRLRNIKLAIVAVPGPAAQQVADTLVASGIRGILNYSGFALRVPEEVMVQDMDPAAHLQRMTYYLG